MEKRFKVEGTDEGTIRISVDGTPTTLSVDSDIQAEEIYKSLQYKPNTTYTFEDGGAGEVAQAPYEAFRDFLKDIVTQVSDLAMDDSAETDELDTEMDDALGLYCSEEGGDEILF